MSPNREVRELHNTLINVLNSSPVCDEVKRIMLDDLSKSCELSVNTALQQELQSITEEGELDNGSKLEQST